MITVHFHIAGHCHFTTPWRLGGSAPQKPPSLPLNTNRVKHMVWRAWTNAECLFKAHTQRLAITDEIKKAEKVSKVAINVGDNAAVNARQNRGLHKYALPTFDNLEIGCRIHCTALAKNKAASSLIQDVITGQTNWALCLNRGQCLSNYKRYLRVIAIEWIKVRRGTTVFSNAQGQRQLMALIFNPHSYVNGSHGSQMISPPYPNHFRIFQIQNIS